MNRRRAHRPRDIETLFNAWPSFVDAMGIAGFLFLLLGLIGAVRGEQSRGFEDVAKEAGLETPADLKKALDELKEAGRRESQAEERAMRFAEELNRQNQESLTGMSVVVDGNEVRVRLPDDITFGAGQASDKALSQAAKAALSSFSSLVRPNLDDAGGVLYIDVEGHADSRLFRDAGEFHYDNWSLSAERAVTVVRFLELECLIPGRNLHVSSYSYFQPADPSNPANSKNRRVELTVRFGESRGHE